MLLEQLKKERERIQQAVIFHYKLVDTIEFERLKFSEQLRCTLRVLYMRLYASSLDKSIKKLG